MNSFPTAQAGVESAQQVGPSTAKLAGTTTQPNLRQAALDRRRSSDTNLHSSTEGVSAPLNQTIHEISDDDDEGNNGQMDGGELPPHEDLAISTQNPEPSPLDSSFWVVPTTQQHNSPLSPSQHSPSSKLDFVAADGEITQDEDPPSGQCTPDPEAEMALVADPAAMVMASNEQQPQEEAELSQERVNENKLLELGIQVDDLPLELWRENATEIIRCHLPSDKDEVTIRTATVAASGEPTIAPSTERPCRFLRHFKDPKHLDRLLRVSFKADRQKEHELGHDGWPARVYKAVKSGIKINEDQYDFLAYSAGNLRSRKCWFLRRDAGSNLPDARAMIRELGNFNDNLKSGIGKFSARIGQLFSKTIFIRNLPLAWVAIEPDFQYKCTTDNRWYCSSDGCGSISLGLMAEVAQHLSLITEREYQIGQDSQLHLDLLRQGKIPTAIQVRLAGAKGMLGVDLSLPRGLAHVVLRPSMIKFLVPHQDGIPLEVCNWSTSPGPAQLNIQIISILEHRLNLAKVSDELNPLLNAMDATRQKYLHIVQAIESQVDSKSLHNAIAGSEVAELLAAGLDPNDTYIVSKIEQIPRDALAKVMQKLNITVGKSRRVYGIVDTTKILRPGEVFFQFSKEYSTEVVQGRVAVFRNPCYHPGDLVLLNAVDHPKLRQSYCNVLVLPSMMADPGDQAHRPHSDEMAGGDLDGDMYMIIYAEELVPKISVPPALYGEYSPKQPPPSILCTRANQLAPEVPMWAFEEMKAFFVRYFISLDKIGELDSLHQKWCKAVGIDHKCSKEIALLISKATDAAKTGEEVLIPPELRNIHVAAKSDQLQGLIDKLHAMISSLYEKVSEREKLRNEQPVTVDMDLSLPDDVIRWIRDSLKSDDHAPKHRGLLSRVKFGQVETWANRHRANYGAQAAQIFAMQKDKDEREKREDRYGAARILQNGALVAPDTLQWSRIRETILRSFWEDHRSLSWPEKFWAIRYIYWLVYVKSRDKTEPNRTPPSLSFAWIFKDYLIMIKNKIEPTHSSDSTTMWEPEFLPVRLEYARQLFPSIDRRHKSSVTDKKHKEGGEKRKREDDSVYPEAKRAKTAEIPLVGRPM